MNDYPNGALGSETASPDAATPVAAPESGLTSLDEKPLNTPPAEISAEPVVTDEVTQIAVAPTDAPTASAPSEPIAYVDGIQPQVSVVPVAEPVVETPIDVAIDIPPPGQEILPPEAAQVGTPESVISETVVPTETITTSEVHESSDLEPNNEPVLEQPTPLVTPEVSMAPSAPPTALPPVLHPEHKPRPVKPIKTRSELRTASAFDIEQLVMGDRQ